MENKYISFHKRFESVKTKADLLKLWALAHVDLGEGPCDVINFYGHAQGV